MKNSFRLKWVHKPKQMFRLLFLETKRTFDKHIKYFSWSYVSTNRKLLVCKSLLSLCPSLQVYIASRIWETSKLDIANDDLMHVRISRNEFILTVLYQSASNKTYRVRSQFEQSQQSFFKELGKICKSWG